MDIKNNTEEYYVKSIEKCDAKKIASLFGLIVFTLPFAATIIAAALNMDVAKMVETGQGGMVNFSREISSYIGGTDNLVKAASIFNTLGFTLSGLGFAINQAKKKKYSQELQNLKNNSDVDFNREDVHIK